ncbi:MAG: hypothetical protein NTY30_04630 [Candidatus Berkelbacteria bacterium]|nr:hypothetical protein [Candidatus Berkelbacteria bacterium]
MRKFLAIISLASLLLLSSPSPTLAAGGIYASGGGAKTVGQSFTVTVSASGATFNALEGTISVSGPVSVSGFSAGGATWTSSPTNGGHFVGMIIPATSSLRVATITLKATGVGSGAVSVSSVRLANAGADAGSGAGSASFTIAKAPDLPGAVKVTSSSHPDPAAAYDATTIALAWNKDSGVDAFSYLLDQAESTTPAAKITDANTSVSYADKAIGVYYFHIRAHKADGWGTTTHFKITIKEPDAKIDETLSKPSDIKIEKATDFVNNIKDGLVTGVIISGIIVPGYTAKITLTPTPALPEGKKYEALANDSGDFSLPIDWPIAAGRYTLTIQGQKDKILTPISDPIVFEISQAKGGSINILTDTDINPPKSIVSQVANKKYNWKLISEIVAGILVLGLIATLIIVRKNKKRI